MKKTKRMDMRFKRKVVHIFEEDVVKERLAHPEIKRKYLNPDLYLFLEGKQKETNKTTKNMK